MLEEIIIRELIYSVYQPIFSLRDGSIYGYEALSRVQGENCYSNVEEMFQEAEQSGKIWGLEQVCRRVALKGIYEQQNTFNAGDKKLFLNVNPQVLHDEKFREGFTSEYLRRYHIDTDRVVFEVTERESVENQNDFLKTIEHYKKQNYGIAIDDVGSAYAGLNLICSLSPHFIKLDINLIRNIHQNPTQYAMVKGMVEFSLNSGILLIAEGIETKKELDILIDLGVQYGQGFYLARPQPLLLDDNEQLRREIVEQNQEKHNKNFLGLERYYIKNLVVPGLTVAPETKMETVLGYIEKNVSALGICVIEDGRVLGIMTRDKMLREVSGRYGFALHHNKTMAEMADRGFLKVDAEAPISGVAKLAMERESDSLYDFIVVTENDRYLGIVTVKNLLKKATEIDVDFAKSSNPLTGLPGNNMIHQEILHCMKQQDIYSIYYLDLDNFKVYNDVYGFEKGDEIIRILADILKENRVENDFIGHIGGDDFIVIRPGKSDENYTEKIRIEFEERAHMLYSEKDRKRKCIEAFGRNGTMECFPLVSVTIVSTLNKDHQEKSGEDIVELLARFKKMEKNRKRYAS